MIETVHGELWYCGINVSVSPRIKIFPMTLWQWYDRELIPKQISILLCWHCLWWKPLPSRYKNNGTQTTVGLFCILIQRLSTRVELMQALHLKTPHEPNVFTSTLFTRLQHTTVVSSSLHFHCIHLGHQTHSHLEPCVAFAGIRLPPRFYERLEPTTLEPRTIQVSRPTIDHVAERVFYLGLRAHLLPHHSNVS